MNKAKDKVLKADESLAVKPDTSNELDLRESDICPECQAKVVEMFLRMKR